MGHLRDFQGSRKVVTITIQAVQETLQGTPTTLPTTEPTAGNEQIGYTVGAGDLPAFNIAPSSVKYVAHVMGAGKAVTAATISYRMKKNTVSVATGSVAVAANTFYTWNTYFYNVAVADVLNLSLWSNQADSNWDYNFYQILPTRIIPKTTIPVLKPFNITTNTAYPTPVLGTPSIYGNYGFSLYHDDQLSVSITSTIATSMLQVGATYGVGVIYNGDSVYSNGAVSRNHATYRPYYMRNYIPVAYNFRALKI